MKRADKPIRYEVHALRRMAQRGINKEQVEQTIHRPNWSRPAKRRGAKKIGRKFSARKLLVVIIEEELQFIRVVSAWWN